MVDFPKPVYGGWPCSRRKYDAECARIDAENAERKRAWKEAVPHYSMYEWQPIKTYPREHLMPDDTYWGEDALLLVPSCEHWPHGPHFHVGWLEADQWTGRAHSEPECCSWLCCEPTHWMPLPKPPTEKE